MLEKIFSDKNKGLKLSDYKNIWTKFCFLDESGSLSNTKDPFFTVGFIKCSQSYYLQSKIIYERQKRNFHDELHFNKLSKNNLEFCKFALDAFFSTRSISFCSYSLDKQGDYFNREFGGDPWRAYEGISIRVLEAAIPPNEIIIVNADYMSVPDNVKFEVNVKRKINEKLNRLAVAGVCRFNSKSNDLLQLADLMVGAINYDLKLATKVILSGDKYKRRLLEHFKGNLGIVDKNFLELDGGFKNYMFNIFIDKDAKQRLPLETNEKGPSS
ncbi:MAG: DUF3800 domain-containing protein [Candidatus Parcubacteria bacterium]|nr:DUF3800 domain-containing protein [Candidatus Parcubacteria bacterium]